MSQEINLLNPALLPKQDPFLYRHVTVAAGAALLIVLLLSGLGRYQLMSAQQSQAASAAGLAAAQAELKTLQDSLAARRNDPAIEQELVQLRAIVKQRGDVLSLARGLEVEGGSVATVMQGFARQRVEGVWLTGFSVGPSGFDIRGRLIDPAMLPAYIRRLNGEPAFRGRQFAALDMHGVVPQPPAATSGATPPPAAPVAPGPTRYTEFALRASWQAGKEGKE